MTVALDTRCRIVGGGPAGMMLGSLLARAGVDVVVLEKHGDFVAGGWSRHQSRAQASGRLPSVLRLVQRFPWLRRIPARVIGMGVRPEHVATPDSHSG